MVRLSLVNMYLHGFSNPKITEYDTLTSEEKWNDTADVILANPPFMTPKGGIRPHKRFSIQAKRSEVLFVDYIAEHLNPSGRAGVIVPEGIIFQSQNAYKQLRKMLVENYLWAVVSLPAGVFNPYSGVKTSILLMDKSLAKKTDKILFVKIESDGFDLGAQRRPIDNNDIPQSLEYLKSFRDALLIGTVTEDNVFAHSVDKAKIAESGDWNLSGDRYKEVIQSGNLNIEWIELGNICDLEYGYTDTAKDAGDTRFIRITDINSDGTLINEDMKFINLSDESKPFLLRKSDLVVARTGATYGKTLYFEEDYPSVFASFLIRFNFNPNKIINKYYWIFTLSNEYRKQKESLVQGGGQPQFNANAIKKIRIPVPSIEVQKEIISEIESYLKIFYGARQVVNNYKPVIKIEPDWQVIELGKISNMMTGGTPSKSNSSFWQGDIPWVSPKDMKNDIITDTIDHISVEAIDNSSTKLVEANIILCVVRSGILVHSFPVAITGTEMSFNQDIIAILPNNDKVMTKYVYYILRSNENSILKNGIKKGVTVQSFKAGFLKEYKMPLPEISIQREIVKQIESEQEIVNANKKLISIYEQKIKDRISEVWDE